MCALSFAAEKSPGKIPAIAILIKKAVNKLPADQLASALSEKITTGGFAVENALDRLMHAISIIDTKSDSPLFTLFFDLLKLKIPTKPPKHLLDVKLKFKDQLTSFLEKNKNNPDLSEMCKPETLLGALIDEKILFGVSDHRKQVNKLIAEQNKPKQEKFPEEITSLLRNLVADQMTALPAISTNPIHFPYQTNILKAANELKKKLSNKNASLDEIQSAFNTLGVALKGAREKDYDIQHHDKVFFELLRPIIDSAYDKIPLPEKTKEACVKTISDPPPPYTAEDAERWKKIKQRSEADKNPGTALDPNQTTTPEEDLGAFFKSEPAENLPEQTQNNSPTFFRPKPTLKTETQPRHAITEDEAALRRKHLIKLARTKYPDKANEFKSLEESTEAANWNNYLKQMDTDEYEQFIFLVKTAVNHEKRSLDEDAALTQKKLDELHIPINDPKKEETLNEEPKINIAKKLT